MSKLTEALAKIEDEALRTDILNLHDEEVNGAQARVRNTEQEKAKAKEQELTEQAEALKGDISKLKEALDKAGNADEATTKRIKNLEAQVAERDEQIGTLKEGQNKLQRTHQLDQVFAGFKFVDESATATGRLVFDSVFATVDLEDETAMRISKKEFEEKASRLLATDEKGGTGARKGRPDEAGSSSSNPWTKGPDWNLTEQGKLIKEDPDKAKLMASEAGVQLVL